MAVLQKNLIDLLTECPKESIIFSIKAKASLSFILKVSLPFFAKNESGYQGNGVFRACASKTPLPFLSIEEAYGDDKK